MAKTGVEGVDRAIAKLRRALPRITGAAVRQIEKEAKDLADAVRQAAPEGPTGNLKKSVEARQVSPTAWEVRAGGELTTKKVRAGVKAKDIAKAKVAQNNKGEFDYARGVEFGHRTPDGEHVPAHPFFYPTYRARKGGIRKRILASAQQAAAADPDLT